MTPSGSSEDKLRILHLINVLRSTNSQYNEHSLPVMDEREITLCAFFRPQLVPPPQIRVFAGDDSVRGFFRVLRKALDASDYDAVHAHSPQMGVFLILAMIGWLRFGLRRRTVYTVHDSFYDYKTRNKLLMIPALGVFARVVFCSHAAYESLPRILKRVVGSRARVVQNGADIERIDRVLGASEAIPRSGFSALSIGRLEPVKDPVTLLKAFALSGGTDDSLVFVGEGDLRSELEPAIEAAGLGERVRLTGLVEREDVFRYLMESDICISTSHGEGLPLAAMEAMACSVPVILSDIPPHREFQADPGLVPLIQPGDVAGFAREIARFRDMTPDDRSRIGRACRDLVVTGFSLDRMNQGYEDIYREIRGDGPRS